MFEQPSTPVSGREGAGNTLPPEKVRQQLRELEAYMKEQRNRAPWLEAALGKSTTRAVEDGKKDPATYESFVIRKKEFPGTNDDVIWICFPGIGGVSDNDSDFTLPLSGSPGTTGISGLPRGIPNKLDVVPQEGTVFIFHGPTAIAGYDPEQCIRATKAVKDAVDSILDAHPNKKVRIFSFSAGTHLGFFVGNQIGRERGPVDKFIAVSPGNSIGQGIYKTWVTEPLARDLLERGVTMDRYDKDIAFFTQTRNMAFLPDGRNLVIHAADNDTFIPKQEPGGTDDLVGLLKKHGKHPTYITHKNSDHIKLPLTLIVQQAMGKDPYHLRDNIIKVWDFEEAFHDTEVTRRVDTILSSFQDNELTAMTDILIEKRGSEIINDTNWRRILSNEEQAFVLGLIRRGIGDFSSEGMSENNAEKARPFRAARTAAQGGFFSRWSTLKTADRNLVKAIASITELGNDRGLALSFESKPVHAVFDSLQAIKNIGIPADKYVCVIDARTFSPADQQERLKLLVSETVHNELHLDATDTKQHYELCTEIKYGGKALTFDELRQQSIDIDGVRVVVLEHADF